MQQTQSELSLYFENPSPITHTVPRQRFSWLNLESSLLERLGSELKLKGDPAAALEKGYGSTPKADFIKDAWPILLESWLTNDHEACSAMAEALRSKGLGDIEIDSPVKYLRSCRNSQSLREACIRLFLEKGKLGSAGSSHSQASGTKKQGEPSDKDLSSAKWDDERKKEIQSRELADLESEGDKDAAKAGDGRTGWTDSTNSTFRATENKSEAADEKAGENAGRTAEPDHDSDQFDSAELRLAIAFLTSDVREELVRLGYLDRQGEWISTDRSTEGFKRAIALASQSTAPLDADLPHSTQSHGGGSRNKPSVSAPIISMTRKAQKTQDQTTEAEPRRTIRWSLHTGPLIIVGALCAVTLSSGPIGFVLLVFVGLPVAFYSFYKDLEDQRQRARQVAMRGPAPASTSATAAIAQKPLTPSSDQEWSEPPSFDYSPRNGKVPDTEEWGVANMRIILNYATDAAIYCLALKASQHGKGKGSRSADIDTIWNSILFMAAEQDKEMAKCLQVAEKSIQVTVFRKLTQDGFCRELSNGELELAEGMPEAEDVRLANTEYAEVEIDGIVFPLLTELSPDLISYYASNKREWINRYPSGAENWHKIATHSRLLSQRRITASQTEAGPWLYTATVDGGIRTDTETDNEAHLDLDQPQSLTDEDSAILSMWELVRPAEAVDLKFIVMDSSGRFAGEFTADDNHGDRYFTVTEDSNGAWSIGSNLTSNDPAKLSKSAKARLDQYRDICAKSTYRYETGQYRMPPNDLTPKKESTQSVCPQSSGALTGEALLLRVRELGDVPPQSLAQACGYVKTIQGSEAGDTEAFYNALFDAHSSMK